MKTAFSTGPGFYAAVTDKTDRLVPAGHIRLFCARLEAYDGPLEHGTQMAETEFAVLPAMAQGRPDVARALLALHDALGANLRQLRVEAGL